MENSSKIMYVQHEMQKYKYLEENSGLCFD